MHNKSRSLSQKKKKKYSRSGDSHNLSKHLQLQTIRMLRHISTWDKDPLDHDRTTLESFYFILFYFLVTYL